MGTEIFDVVVIGAGPAGASAAAFIAQREWRVALVDKAQFPRDTVSAAWLNAKAEPLLGELGVPTKSLLDCAFRDVTFYSSDLVKKATPTISAAPGYVVDRSAFCNAIVQAAVTAGVTILGGRDVSHIQAKENGVLVRTGGGETVEGRLLIFAAGRSKTLLEQIGLPLDSAHVSLWTAQVDALNTAKGPKSPVVAVVLGLDKKGSFGLCCATSARISVAVNVQKDSGLVVPTLVTLCKAAFERGVIPMDLSALAARAEVIPSPAAAALDMDTHVRKHALVIGDAGGFVAATSNEGIYPAMWSAKIAAGVAHTALEAAAKGTPSQDQLMAFDTAWRIQMADYLRSPHTDIQFLLPLIFSNQQMADRMAAAFFAGENI
ncbi:MAG: FAD-dependent oxidoreductase [Planctomycetota bacterium]